jgi:hypothetical protein
MWKYKWFVLAAVFVVLGCEDLMDGGGSPAIDTAGSARWAVMARDGESLKAAVEDGSVETIYVEADLDASDVDLDLRTVKSIVIPAGVTVIVRSINSAANAGVIGKDAAEESIQKAAKSMSGSDGTGILKVSGGFYLDKNSVFEVKKGVKLVFDSTVTEIVVDGFLRCEQEDSVYALEGGEFHLSGEGSVEIGGGGSKAAEEFELKVIAGETSPGGGTGNLAAIGYRDTANKSAGDIFDIDSWTGSGTAAESWTLNAVEKSAVHFAVTKAADQTITAGGKDAERVTVTVDGSSVDGTTTGGMLAAVTVDANDKALDGGEYRFNLLVSQGGKQIKTVDVTLNSKIDDTYGITIFRVKHENGVEKLENLNAKIGVETEADHTANPVPVNTLYNANRWLEFYAEGGTEQDYSEYLIRLNEDQETKPIAVVLNGRDYVKLRLRGGGGERRIYRDKGFNTSSSKGENGIANLYTPFQYKGGNGGVLSLMGDGLIALYPNKDSESGVNNGHLIFVLEKNVTIDGDNISAGKLNESAFKFSDQLLAVNANTTVIMREGSKITGYCCNFYKSVQYAPVYIRGENSTFIMDGGVITGNTYLASSFADYQAFDVGKSYYFWASVKYGMILVPSGMAATFTFIYKSGEISGNTPDDRKVGYYGNDNYPYVPLWSSN